MLIWSSAFETILRARCLFADPDRPIDPDIPLTLLGVDSVQMLRMIVEIEDILHIKVPDAVLASAVFGTARSVWGAVAELVDAR